MQSVSCTQLCITAGRRRLVSDFTWSCTPGGVAWLIGSNGSGKSSLLRVLAGWRASSSGEVRWEGLSGHRIRYLAPAMTGPPDLRVCDFVRFVRAGAHESAEHPLIAALFPRTADLSRSFGSLSSGEAKRLLLWALLREGAGPLVLDEPYEYLSREAKEALTVLLHQCARRSVVVVATNQEVTEQPNDAVLLLEGDRIEVRNGL